MGDRSGIEWTDATWNPVTGCSKVSPGCAHCYAETLSHRFGRTRQPWTREHAAENVAVHPDRLGQPLKWRRPRMVFVNSMSDLFHEEIPIEFLAEVWDMMARTQQHTYQVLTKRPERVAELLGPRGIGFYDVEGAVPCPLPNVWIGVSIENARHTFRVRELQVIPAAVKFVSAEPLLGSLFDRGRPGCWDGPADLAGVDWLIVGGESGPRARPMRIEWARELRDAARAAGVAFFFKQWGGRTSKAQGRELDGRTWDEFPGHHPAPSLDEASAHAA